MSNIRADHNASKPQMLNQAIFFGSLMLFFVLAAWRSWKFGLAVYLAAVKKLKLSYPSKAK